MSVSPPRPKGPPLNALRAFEAAARLGGFAAAAEELSVTPGAVSQHVKALEDWAGTPLFQRRAQGVRLTRTGAGLLPGLTAAFDQLGDAVRGLRDAAPSRAFEIAALPSVAQLWLSPRMPAVRRQLPGQRVSVTAMENPPNLKRDMFDLTLFIAAPTGGSGERVLEEDVIFPVCAPEIAARLKTPADLRSETLLRDVTWPEDWALWAGAAGVDLSTVPEGPGYSLYALAVEETKNGVGVLIGHGCLVDAALREGSLVAPFDLRVSTGKALVLSATGRARRLVELVAG